MYGIKRDWNSLPPMPVDRDTWSVMQSWALPTRSFLEFVMFSRYWIQQLSGVYKQVELIFSNLDLNIVLSAGCLWMHWMPRYMMTTIKEGTAI